MFSVLLFHFSSSDEAMSTVYSCAPSSSDPLLLTVEIIRLTLSIYAEQHRFIFANCWTNLRSRCGKQNIDIFGETLCVSIYDTGTCLCVILKLYSCVRVYILREIDQSFSIYSSKMKFPPPLVAPFRKVAPIRFFLFWHCSTIHGFLQFNFVVVASVAKWVLNELGY